MGSGDRRIREGAGIGSAFAFHPYWFGAYLAVIGFFDRSHQLLARAHEYGPLSLVVPSVQGWARIFARRFDDALPFLREVLSIDPNFHLALWFKGEALVELGRYEEGIAALARLRTGRPDFPATRLRRPRLRPHRADRARRSASLNSRRTNNAAIMCRLFFALILGGLGENERALDRLEEAFHEGDTMLRDLKVDPHWDRMRSLPRSEALM